VLSDIPALRAATWPTGRPDLVNLVNNHTAGDGGGVFRWDAASTATDNGGTIIKETAVTTGRWVRQFSGPVNVKWFGAIGDGSDATTAIDAANAAANTLNCSVYIPTGNYTYTGSGLTGTTLEIIGEGQQNTVIILGAGKYFIDDSGVWGSLKVESIRFVNGAGAIRSRYTPAMVQAKQIVRDCEFVDYTGPAISGNSSDSPDWTIENNVFKGANGTTCIGIALSGLSDSNRIFGNTFRLNKAHIKLAEGANNAYILANDFLRFASGTGRVDIWVVPDVDGTNSGTGLWIGPNKFGNEFRATDGSEPCILYADQGSGTWFGDKLPSLTVSTGHINGHTVTGAAAYANGGSANTPFIRSYTPNVFGCQYTNFTFGGQRPTFVIEWAAGATPTALAEGSARLNLVGPIACDSAAGDSLGLDYASSYNTVRVNNPAQDRIVLNTLTSSIPISTTAYVGASGSDTTINVQQWRFPFNVQLINITVYCVTGAVGAGGTVTVTSVLNGAAGTITGSFGGAAAFSGTFSGSENLVAAASLQIQLTTNASAAAQRYLVVVSARRAW
jgi:hypothetical protein